MAKSDKTRKSTDLKELLNALYRHEIDVDEFLKSFKLAPFVELGDACLDVHRVHRKDFPEVIFCMGKSKKQIKKIAKELYKRHKRVLLTRADEKIKSQLKKSFPKLKYYKKAGVILIGSKLKERGKKVGIVTAGTGDIPVAEEAAVTCEAMGRKVQRFYDVGVAGIHRLTNIIGELAQCGALIVVAGMEGALPSIIAGILDVPVIGVPTSVGYGTNISGFAPLLTMLNSCAPGLVVVNVDNGFGAGFFATMISK